MTSTTETLAIVLVFSVPILAILSVFARQWLTVRAQEVGLKAFGGRKARWFSVAVC